MLVPVGTRHIANVTATIWRPVRCEFCRCEFAYQLTRRGTGMSSAPLALDMKGADGRSADRAYADLTRTLLNPKTVDPVPCPDCGKYQAAMVAKIRRDSWKAVTILGWLALTVALFAFFIALAMQRSPFVDPWFFGPIAAGVFFFAVQRIHAASLDPNAGPIRKRPSRGKRRNELEAFVARERAAGRAAQMPSW